MGKVTVIKSVALPKLVFQFTVLPNPPNEIITDITKSISPSYETKSKTKLKENRFII